MVRLTWSDIAARPFVLPAAMFALGVALGGNGTLAHWGWAVAIAAALASVGVFLSRRAGSHLCVLFSWVAAGAGLAAWEAQPRIPGGMENADPIRLEGVVESVADLGKSTRLEIAVSRVVDSSPSEARFRVTLYANAALDLYEGQRVLFPARLRTDFPVANPGQWDTRAYRQRRVLLYTGTLDPRRLVVLSAPARWQVWLRSTHQRLSARVHQLSPTPQAASVYLTLAAGLRAELGDGLEAQFAASGLAHVLSVSGLHVAALALLVLRLIRAVVVRLGLRRWDARRVAAPLSVPVIWAYVIFTGNQTPAVRSAVMATAVMIGMSLWRRADALNSLAVACVVLLAFDPSGIADLSLQLSFLAVLSLILVAPAFRQAVPIERPDSTSHGWRRWLRKHAEEALQVFCASAAVSLAGFPLIAATFHRASLAGLVSNIVCLPLCGVLTALAAGGAAAFVVAPWLATPVLWAGGYGSQILLWLVRFFAALPGASRAVPSLSSWQTTAFFLALFVFGIGRGRWRLLGLLAPLVLVSLYSPVPWQSPHGLKVTFLSVGHGDAIVLSSAGKHALIDGGGVPGGADTGRKYVIPFLRESRADHLELTVLSHPHPDHALGLVSTLREIPTRRLWYAAQTEGELTSQVVEAAVGAQVEAVQVGTSPLQLGDATVEVIGPPVDKILLKSANNRSVVLLVRHRDVTFLLPGDIEEAAEEGLDVPRATVLKAPHHGSRTASSQSFVDKSRPRFVVFCVGRNNRFHLPSPEVVDRYLSIGAECFRTDFDGAVSFESDGIDVRWNTFLPHQALPAPRTNDASAQ